MRTASYDFTDETVIVTGGSSGIGRSVSLRFGSAGADVIVADVRETPKAAEAETPTHRLIRERGGSAKYVETDVSDPEAVTAVVDAARSLGGVDVMVNNAGVYRGAPLVETSVETFDELHAVNVRGVFAGCRAAARDMLDRGVPGRIINTASISSEDAQVGHAAYDATKGAISMLTRVCALELAHEGIRVNAVAPGSVATEIGGGHEVDPDWEPPDVSKSIPMGRPAEADEIAGCYLFLASDDASYVTGHLLRADGGYGVL